MSIDSTSFFSYIYSSWLTKYLWKAYRKGITLSDIPSISTLDTCVHNAQKFENLWNEELRRRGPTSASLSLVAWRFVRFRVLTACFLNAISQIIRFLVQTILLKKLLEHCEIPRYFLSGLYAVILIVGFDFLQTVFQTWSDIMNQRTALRLKAVCLSLLFKKVVNLNNIADKNSSEVMYMLSKDAHKIYDAVNYSTSIINAPIVMICAVICIPWWLSSSALTGLAVFLSFYVFQYWLRHLINYCKVSANKYTKTRMQKTIEILNFINLIKINNWEQHFIQNILNIRNRESKWLWKLSYVKSLNSALAHAIPLITIIVMFFMHISTNPVLRSSVAFSICVVILVQMHETFMTLKTSLSHLKDSSRTFKKIKKGLLLEDTSCYATKPYEPSQAVAIINGSFVYEVCTKPISPDAASSDKTYDMDENHKNGSEEKEKLNNPTFEPTRKVILSNVTLKVKKGQLIGITGQANSGKSSLLLAALGQIKMNSGQLMRQGTCAYVAQKPWIANATIRENILFGESYDEKRYYEAQIVCKLRQDIKMLPDGDETEIGEGGLQISEKLKQKVALARAFYADRDIYFLDEPLSSMEDSVSEEIFEDFIIRALAEKTILFVTHELKYLDRCDYIYIIRDGKIAEYGKHKELMRLGKEYASMARIALVNAEGDYANEFFDRQENGFIKRKISFMKNVNLNQKIFKNNDISNNLELEETNSSNDDDTSTNNDTPIGLEEIKGMTYYTYAKSLGGLFLLLPIILVYFIYSSIGIHTLLRLYWWIEAINKHKEANFASYKNWYGFCFFLIILGCIVQSFVVQLVTTKIADNLHNALLNKIIQAPVKLFETASIGKIRNLFSHDLHNVSLSLPSKLDSTLRYMVIALFTFYVLISTIPWFTNFVVFNSILFFFVAKIYRIADKNLTQLENELKLPTNSFLRNSIQGLSTIRTFKKENDLLSKFQDLVDKNNACCFVKSVSEKWLSIRLKILTTACLFVAASLIIIMKDEISLAIAGLTFVYLFQVPYVIQMGLKYFSKTENNFINVQNICNYFQTLKSECDDKICTSNPDPNWPINGSIEFHNVQLQCDNDVNLALNLMTFVINNAEKIGILAKTDADRNSFIAVMYRLYELNGGKITIDSIDISKIEIKLLRNQLSLIPKEPIFYGTVRFFLDPKKCHTDADIWNALERMQMKSKISALASQLHYTIDGKMFTIVEKQLLFFARAFLSRKKILIFEENAISDRETSALIHQVIEKEFSNITVIIITNCLRTILSCDRVLLMEAGRVLEFDSPSTLLANQGSNLKKLMIEDAKMNGAI